MTDKPENNRRNIQTAGKSAPAKLHKNTRVKGAVAPLRGVGQSPTSTGLASSTMPFEDVAGGPGKRDAPRLSRPESWSGPDADAQAARASGEFFRRVYAIVAEIPKGAVMTYGQIAALLDNICSARYVGFAMSAAPPGLPCHRVVNRAGEMAPHGIFGGEDRQRALLQSEGVMFRKNGRVDMAISLFRP